MRFFAASASAFCALTLLVACVGDAPSPVTTDVDGGAGNDATTPGIDGAAPADTGGGDSGADAIAPTCGAPGQPCCNGTTCQGGAQCTANLCACPADKTTCGASCVDAQNDTANCGRCGHDCSGGACTAGQCKAYTVVTGQSTLSSMLVDPASGRLFWTRSSNGVVTGGVFSAKLDGTDLKTHYQLAVAEPCTGIAIAKGNLYFICKAGAVRELRSCTLPACATTTVTTPSLNVLAGPLTADPASGRVFYAVSTSYGNAPDGTILESTGATVGSLAQPNPGDITFANGYVFWLDSGTYLNNLPQKNGGVYRAALGSLATQELVVGANTIYYDSSSLAVDAINAYYVGRNSITNKSDVIVAPAAGGGGLTVFAADLDVHAVASDGTNVFFDDQATQSVRYCPRAAGCGGATRSLADAEVQAYAIALDTPSVLWVTGGGLIRRIAKP